MQFLKLKLPGAYLDAFFYRGHLYLLTAEKAAGNPPIATGHVEAGLASCLFPATVDNRAKSQALYCTQIGTILQLDHRDKMGRSTSSTRYFRLS